MPPARPSEDHIAAVYRETVEPLYRFIARRVGPRRSLCEDIVQETYARAVEHWMADGLPEKPLAWLHVVARNILRDAFRRTTPPRVPLDGVAHLLVEPEAGDPTDAAPLVQWALARLRADRARLLELFHVEGMSVREIARHLDRTEKSVERRLARARDGLRRVLRRAGTHATITAEISAQGISS